MTGTQQAILACGGPQVGAPAWNCTYKGSLPSSTLSFNLDGTVSSSVGGGTGSFVGAAGFARWYPTAAVSGAFWIRGTVTAGTLDNGAGTWRQITTSINFIQSSAASSQSATLTFDISTTSDVSGIFWTSPGNIIARQYP